MTLNPHPVVFEAAADAFLWCDATGFRLFSTAHVSPAHCDQCRQQHAAVPSRDSASMDWRPCTSCQGTGRRAAPVTDTHRADGGRPVWARGFLTMAGLSRRDRRGLIGFTHIYAENESLLVPLRGLRIEPGRYQARTVSVKWKEGYSRKTAELMYEVFKGDVQSGEALRLGTIPQYLRMPKRKFGLSPRATSANSCSSWNTKASGSPSPCSCTSSSSSK